MEDDGTGMPQPATGQLYLVDSRILPEALLKTAEVSEILRKGRTSSVGEATRIVGISRSVYYRYKDYIHPFNDAARQRIVTLSMELAHEQGVLSGLLSVVAKHQGNILTINQGIPNQGVALASLAVDTSMMPAPFEDMLGDLRRIQGVVSLNVIGEV